MSDAPPRDGFGGKVSIDGTQLHNVFQGREVPAHLQPTPEEIKQREIAKMVNEGEGAALGCLGSILKQTEAAMSKCESAMEAESEKARAAVAEMDERGPESYRPGVRVGRGRKKKKSKTGGSAGGGGAGDASSSSDDDEGEEGDEADEGEHGRSKHWRHLPTPVFQGTAEYFPPPAADEEAEVTYDEYGEVVPPPLDLGPVADRLHRIIAIDSATSSATSSAKASFPNHPWPTVTVDEMITLMRRARFFREAELQEDFLPVVAEWFELQCYDAGTVIAEEGTWCHSLMLLHSGTLEARGRVYCTPGALPPRGAGLLGALAKPKDAPAPAGGGAKGGKENAADNHEHGDEDKFPVGSVPDLPPPTLVGPYDTLAPLLLHPGSYYGEAALAGPPDGPRFPHTCTVRTLSRCVLLALRRTPLVDELANLPVTARQAWAQQSLREQKLFSHVLNRWRHHHVRRLRIFKSMEPKSLGLIERMGEYRLLPMHTCLLRPRERGSHLYIVLDGQVGEFDPHAPPPAGAPAAGLTSLLSSAQDITDEDEPPLPPKLTSSYYEGHDVTDCRPGLRHSPPAPPPPSPHGSDGSSPLPDGSTPLPDEPPAATSVPHAPLPVLRRTISDASDVPFVGEAPLLLPTVHEATSEPPSTTIALTLTQCQVLAIPYAELARRGPNLLLELKKRVTDTRSQPSALMALLTTPAKGQKGAAKLAAAGNAIASALGMGGGLAAIVSAAANDGSKLGVAAVAAVGKAKPPAKPATPAAALPAVAEGTGGPLAVS